MSFNKLYFIILSWKLKLKNSILSLSWFFYKELSHAYR